MSNRTNEELKIRKLRCIMTDHRKIERKDDNIEIFKEISQRYTKISLKKVIIILNMDLNQLERLLMKVSSDFNFIIQDDVIRFKYEKEPQSSLYTCFFYRNILEDPLITRSQDCDRKIVRCEICKRPIAFSSLTSKCLYCEKFFNPRHLEEFVKM